MARSVEIRVTVNGVERTGTVEARTLLADWLRDELALTGTHVGCEHGVCGSCTVLIDGGSRRSCLMLAAQADGRSVTTVEALAGADGEYHPVQQGFHEEHGLQCGFCTPGFLMSAVELLETNPAPDEAAIREWLSGNICRCTGYQHIVRSVQRAAQLMAK